MSFEGVFVGEQRRKWNLKWLPFESRLERSLAKANKLWFKFRFPIKGPSLRPRHAADGRRSFHSSVEVGMETYLFFSFETALMKPVSDSLCVCGLTSLR